MPAKTKLTKKATAKTKKSISGGGGLKSAKRLNLKLLLPLVLVLASVGGYMVWKSSAAPTQVARRYVSVGGGCYLYTTTNADNSSRTSSIFVVAELRGGPANADCRGYSISKGAYRYARVNRSNNKSIGDRVVDLNKGHEWPDAKHFTQYTSTILDGNYNLYFKYANVAVKGPGGKCIQYTMHRGEGNGVKAGNVAC